MRRVAVAAVVVGIAVLGRVAAPAHASHLKVPRRNARNVQTAGSSSSATIADDQSAVNSFFEANSSYWNDVYHRDDVTSLIVQQRSEIALSWADQLRLPPGSTVLEVGCGAGLMAVALAQRGLRVYATDTVTPMIDLTRARAAASGVSHLVETRTSDVHALDFDDATFDLVIALGVIPWLHSPSKALHEMARVLKPRRTLIASANNAARLHYLFDPKLTPHLGGARSAVKNMLRMRSRQRSGGPNMNLHSCEEFERLLSSASLTKERGRAVGYGPFTFLGRRILPERIGVNLHNWLQGLADRGFDLIASRGAQYMVAARKEGVRTPHRSLR